MKLFTFGSHKGGESWGEVQQICIIANDESQAWLILEEEKKIIFHKKDWALEEVNSLDRGVVFSTSYTLGV